MKNRDTLHDELTKATEPEELLSDAKPVSDGGGSSVHLPSSTQLATMSNTQLVKHGEKETESCSEMRAAENHRVERIIPINAQNARKTIPS